MAVAEKIASEPRWLRTLRNAEALADDLGVIGVWVGPRTGAAKRTHGEKEDYVLRRVLIALKQTGRIPFPAEVRAERDGNGHPDFTLLESDGTVLGIEVTEAGHENYQKWLTDAEKTTPSSGQTKIKTFGLDTTKAAEEIINAVRKKVAKFDEGKYCITSKCDLAVYDNTAYGGFLDKRSVVAALGHPTDLLGRFRQIHLVTDTLVILDVFGNSRNQVDISRTYEADYAGWIFDQVERLRRGDKEELDLAHIAEELEDLGNSERRALGSHLRILLVHLLKLEHQPERRSDSWRASIENARSEIDELLMESPSLRPDLDRQRTVQYTRARRQAAIETNLPLERFSEACPYRLEQLLDPDFPGRDG